MAYSNYPKAVELIALLTTMLPGLNQLVEDLSEEMEDKLAKMVPIT
jgi:methanogenic corrinoid protein MtbC1